MLTVYADESSDQKKEVVFAVGGMVGTEDEWKAIEDPWKTRMKGLVFHASNLESGHGDFKGFSEKDRRRWYRDLIEIINASPLIGLGTAVDLGDFWSIFPNVDKDSPYLLCFGNTIIDFAALARVYIPSDEIKFVFDQNQDYENKAAKLFDILSKNTDWRDHNRLDELSFSSREKRIGLQVADLVARETFKHRHNQLTSTRTTRLSIKKLAYGSQFRFFTRRDLELIHGVAVRDGNNKPLAEYALDVAVTAAIRRN